MKTRNAYCSFCRKSYQEIGDLVEGPDNVFICDPCIELCRTIIDQERKRRQNPPEAAPTVVDPAVIRAGLDRLVSGQQRAKAALAVAAAQRREGIGHVLLAGPSRAAQHLLARALAHVLGVPLAVGNGGELLVKGSTETFCPLIYRLLTVSQFDTKAADQGVLFVAGADRTEVQQALVRFWQGEIGEGMARLGLNLAGILFVCGGTFEGLEEAVARFGQNPDQPLTPQDLAACGARPEWVRHLRAVIPVERLNEGEVDRLLSWVDFRRAEVNDSPQ